MGRALMWRFAKVVTQAGICLAVGVAFLVPQIAMILRSGEAAGVLAVDQLPQRSMLLASDGSTLASLFHDQNRTPITIDQVPQVLIDTILAVEDQAFYTHGGVNLRAAVRALVSNVAAGGVEQGGSTITQQLVKQTLLTPEQTLDRKLREAVLSRRLEQDLTKDEILERYLNTVYLGNFSYGVQAAAETYFGKDVEDLELADAVLIAGMIRNPVGYDPITRPDEARRRRRAVTDRLVSLGQIDDQEAEQVNATPLPEATRVANQRPTDYFTEEVVRLLMADERMGETVGERYNAVFKGGLTIKTTLDPRLQQQALDAVNSTLPDTNGRFTAAIVSVEPGTGAVRTLVGGPGFEQLNYNIATQGVGRQPGSSFKPFVLAAALENGRSPNDTIDGTSPCTIRESPKATPWTVRGAGGGILDLWSATSRSINCAYARLALIVGVDKVAETAKKLGITTALPEYPSMALGGIEVRPLDMAAAYATFAADGVYHKPYYIEEVSDRNGKVIFREDGKGEQVISSKTARLVNQALRGVVSGGTGTRARFADGRQVAGKTGTTNKNRDVWFVGYVPQLATAVWMGSATGLESMTNVAGLSQVFGGTFPARIWQAFMGPAMEGREKATFPTARAAGGQYLRLQTDPTREELEARLMEEELQRQIDAGLLPAPTDTIPGQPSTTTSVPDTTPTTTPRVITWPTTSTTPATTTTTTTTTTPAPTTPSTPPPSSTPSFPLPFGSGSTGG
ncbi:MAG: PBP1A family penicillin-binding protein [Acidimicrobiales bacterium]